jgi:endonuclease YncB( thermonuclease family)
VAPMSATLAAEPLTGKVVAIADGDPLTPLVDRQQIKVRLSDIEAPEKAQPYGTRARRELARLAFGRTVRVETTGKDKYRRTLGRVYVDDRGRECPSGCPGLRVAVSEVFSRQKPRRGRAGRQTRA